ncbi:transcription termination factor Rho [Amycolatopsis lexingtonensis]|uniref:Transcription termination factor Rho n=1 Tax=Amycolatopsis lexingtonensis TaxID=218822 RepID=A0ABR9HQ77_9PSEU|nr:transcription termination factor Rho [Amycolatopsis lexingtonensis]MBE1493074.1 transcription termination factor Rho [Amycolatopsis lexingtonensis]
MPFHGILDLSGKTPLVRRGYRHAPDDVAIPLSLVSKHKLRAGDEITGTAEEIISVDGVSPDEPRPHFADLVPLHPEERLLLETTPSRLLPRVIDLVTPLGKGQRALVVSPPKAGKTTVLQEIGHGIATNHPDCRLLVLLADERPEEVTELSRTVRGEVIASTFDRPPAEHVAVAELTVERAKRLVERGEDVVLLLDSLTRLGRAYNLSARPSGRTLSGGVDAAALQPMKRLLGAARNVEGGGSLTVVATALVETGSLADTVFFEELKSTGNAELRLDRKAAERRVFPAVYIPASGTRREELLVTPGELAAMREVRRALSGPHGIEQLLEQLRKTGSNAEFLLRVMGAAAPKAA